MEEINILKSRYICPNNNSIEDCNESCPCHSTCEGWKEIMFQYIEDLFGSLARGLFLR